MASGHKGNFLDNLFSWEVGGKAFVQGAISTTFTIAGAVGGFVLFGPAGAVYGGAIGSMGATLLNGQLFNKAVGFSDVMISGAFGALAGGFIAFTYLGTFATSGARFAGTLLDVDRSIVNSAVDTVPAKTPLVKPPM